jgi:hypothetical protein
MQHARAALNKLYRNIVHREGDDAAITAWPLACGGKIAARTTALSFANGVLTVSVPDDSWRQQLQSFTPQYLASLNQIVQEPVKRIEFRIASRQQ